MEQWEYLTTFIEANVRTEATRSFLKQRFPGRKKMPRFAPESMMPELDKLGEQGWELVHMEPVAKVGGKGDVLFAVGPRWSNRYFCVFKRLKPAPAAYVPAQPVTGTPPQS